MTVRVRVSHITCRFLFVAASLWLNPAQADVIASVEVQGNTRTHTPAILRELQFRSGDTLNTTLVAESERILRRLLFLGRVQISTQAAGPDSVHVVVEVDDLYARALSPLFSGDAEEISAGTLAVDYNLFGRGQYLQATAFDDARAGRRITTQYRNPRFGGSRIRLAAEMGWAEEGHTVSASLSQPFFALSTPWAFGVSASSHQARSRLYRGGTLTEMYEDQRQAASAWLVRSYGDRLKIRPGIQLRVSDRTFASKSPFTYQPEDRRRVTPSLILTLWQPSYRTQRFIQYLGPEEDFQTGSSASIQIGLSAQAIGSDRGYRFASLRVAPRLAAGGWFLLTNFSIQSRWRQGGYESLLSNSSARLFGRLLAWPFTPTLAARLSLSTLSRPEDSGSQYLIGGDSGLRGYVPRRFDGSRRLTANVELRPLFVRRSGWALGGAVFADVGGAWDQEPSLHAALGSGLRLGLPRLYNTPVMRLDLARGFNGGVWQISFGLGQYF